MGPGHANTEKAVGALGGTGAPTNKGNVGGIWTHLEGKDRSKLLICYSWRTGLVRPKMSCTGKWKFFLVLVVAL